MTVRNKIPRKMDGEPSKGRGCKFDRSNLTLASLCDRKHNLNLTDILPLESPDSVDPTLYTIASKIHTALEKKASVILMMGAHVIRAGVQRCIIDLMEKGYLSCIAMNGAGVIHDFEFSLIGGTTESVEDYIKEGHFGFWRQTGRINDIVTEAAQTNKGLGAAVGEIIETEKFPHRRFSLLAAGFRLGIPITVHVGIGYDILHQLPNCRGSAYGKTSYHDFLTFAGLVNNLENGVVMNFGSAVMAPEVFLKALSMARNVARQNRRSIQNFTALVCDLQSLPENYQKEAPKSDPLYYFRPWKTMLVRTVVDGGQSYYVSGDHTHTVPGLWAALNNNS
jgi:hypothetical protein